MRDQRGFTLIELLCALTILALVLGVSMRILSGASHAAIASRDYARMLALASAHLTSLEAEENPAIGQRRGEEAGLNWQDSISREDSSAFADATALKITALRLESRARSAGGREVTLRSVRLERLK